MSPLYSYNGLLLSVDGALAASEDCCCEESGCGCYQIDYVWNINEEDCNQSLTGTLLVGSGGIQCYDVPGAISVNNALIAYGPICGEVGNTELLIDCGNEVTTIGLFIETNLSRFDLTQTVGNLCCGAVIGEFVFPSGEIFYNQSFTMNISLYSSSNCDCSGYTPVV